MFETNDCGNPTHISLVFLGFSTFLVLFVYSVIPFCTFLNLLIEIIFSKTAEHSLSSIFYPSSGHFDQHIHTHNTLYFTSANATHVLTE